MFLPIGFAVLLVLGFIFDLSDNDDDADDAGSL